MLELDIRGGFSRNDVEVIAGLLSEGGLGIIPTDTVYGFAVLASNREAVKRLLKIKERPADKPLPVQSSSKKDANEIAVLDHEPGRTLASVFWPGALTLVLDRRPGIELPFQDPDTIGVRVPDNGFCRALLGETGYLLVPSANPAGATPPVSKTDIAEELAGSVDFLVNGGRCPAGVPSTVVDVSARVVKKSAPHDESPPDFQYDIGHAGFEVLREGAVSVEDIIETVGKGATSGKN